MQVLLFIGENFYPRPNLGDFIKVMPNFPTDEELLAIVIDMMANRDRFSIRAEWASAMSVDPVTNETKMVHWAIEYETDQEKLKRIGCAAIREDGRPHRDGWWYGVRNEEVDWND